MTTTHHCIIDHNRTIAAPVDTDGILKLEGSTCCSSGFPLATTSLAYAFELQGLVVGRKSCGPARGPAVHFACVCVAKFRTVDDISVARWAAAARITVATMVG